MNGVDISIVIITIILTAFGIISAAFALNILNNSLPQDQFDSFCIDNGFNSSKGYSWQADVKFVTCYSSQTINDTLVEKTRMIPYLGGS